MKFKLTFALIFLSAITVRAQIGTRGYLDQISYHGIRLGDSISKLQPKLIKLNEAVGGKITGYKYNESSALIFNNTITVEEVDIYYFRNKVAEIYLYFKKDDLSSIRDYFDQLYGTAGPSAEEEGICQYYGKHAQVVLRHTKADDRYSVLISYPDE
jgi:hypothetical protein